MVIIIAAVLIELLLLVLVGMGAVWSRSILLLLIAHAVYLVGVFYSLQNACGQPLHYSSGCGLSDYPRSLPIPIQQTT